MLTEGIAALSGLLMGAGTAVVLPTVRLLAARAGLLSPPSVRLEGEGEGTGAAAGILAVSGAGLLLRLSGLLPATTCPGGLLVLFLLGFCSRCGRGSAEAWVPVAASAAILAGLLQVVVGFAWGFGRLGLVACRRPR